MADCKTPSRKPVRRDRSVEARREARLKKDARERRIIGMLNRGVSIAEIAAREGVTLRRMQIVVKDILARRAPPAPSEYLALQVSRLNEAMMVAYGSMAGGNLTAVDRVVRLVKEMDRYHGFFPSGGAGAAAPDRLAPPAEAPLALAAPTAMVEKWRRKRLKRLVSAMGMASAPGRDHEAAAARGGCDGNGVCGALAPPSWPGLSRPSTRSCCESGSEYRRLRARGMVLRVSIRTGQSCDPSARRTAWMAGTSPAMTACPSAREFAPMEMAQQTSERAQFGDRKWRRGSHSCSPARLERGWARSAA